MNAYAKLVDIIGQKRAVIDKLRAELAPLEEVLVMLEKDYDEMSALRLRVRNLMSIEQTPLPEPEPERPVEQAPAPDSPPAAAAVPAPTRTNKQQQIFDALIEPMAIAQLRAKFPHIKSVDSLVKVLRLKGAVELDRSDWRYHRVSGVVDVPKTLPGKTA